MRDRPNFEDRTLTCADCGEEFTFATGEQIYFWAKGLSEPKRCKACRVLRRRSLVSVMDIEEEHNADKANST